MVCWPVRIPWCASAGVVLAVLAGVLVVVLLNLARCVGLTDRGVPARKGGCSGVIRKPGGGVKPRVAEEIWSVREDGHRKGVGGVDGVGGVSLPLRPKG